MTRLAQLAQRSGDPEGFRVFSDALVERGWPQAASPEALAGTLLEAVLARELSLEPAHAWLTRTLAPLRAAHRPPEAIEDSYWRLELDRGGAQLAVELEHVAPGALWLAMAAEALSSPGWAVSCEALLRGWQLELDPTEHEGSWEAVLNAVGDYVDEVLVFREPAFARELVLGWADGAPPPVRRRGLAVCLRAAMPLFATGASLEDRELVLALADAADREADSEAEGLAEVLLAEPPAGRVAPIAQAAALLAEPSPTAEQLVAALESIHGLDPWPDLLTALALALDEAEPAV